MKRFAIITAILLVIAFIPSLLAQGQESEQQRDTQTQQQEGQTQDRETQLDTQRGETRQYGSQTEQTFRGELVSVDTTEQKLTAKDSEGTEMEFVYNDQTQVSGADQEIAGLATKSGSMVTITYSEEGQTKTAKTIHVEQQSQSPGLNR